MGVVFVNYRSNDQPLGAASIHDQLARRFGGDQVFRDCVSMKAADHYPTKLTTALEAADVLVSVIGPSWLNCVDDAGSRRIDNERDWVRREIARAFERGIPVVPVLLQDTPENTAPPKAHELPDALARLATTQSFQFSQLRFGADMDALIARLVELVPALVIPQLFEVRPVSDAAQHAPSTMLRPEYAIVPFRGRTRELGDLTAWALGTATYSAMLVVGPAGVGKTRLAHTLADDLRGQGWLAGVVSGEAPAAQVRNTLAIDQPLLAIVDDAELRADELVALAGALAERATRIGVPGRLLLLARSDGEWLTTLRNGTAAGTLFDSLTDESVMRLGRAAIDPRVQYDAARLAFAAALRRPPRATTAPAFPGTATVLSIHATALTDVLGGSVGEDALTRVNSLDGLYLRTALPDAARTDLSEEAIAAVRVFATLCRPGSEAEAEAVRAKVSEALGLTPGAVAACRELLDTAFPGRYPFAPTRPDALAEPVLADTLAAQPGLVLTLATTCTEDQVLTAFTVLGRAMVHHPTLRDAVVRLARARPEHHLLLGATAATRLAEPEPFVRALAAALPESGLGARETMALMDRVARTGPSLNPLKAAVHRHFTEVVALPAGEQVFRGPHTANVPEPLRKLAENGPRALADIFANVIDPKVGRRLENADGSPVLGDFLMELVRGIWVNRDLFPPDDEKHPR
jgi:DNA polymerase III delta prime subunit